MELNELKWKRPLRKCPFCGSEARVYFGNTNMYGVTCRKCFAKVYGYKNTGEAKRAWNRRGQTMNKFRCLLSGGHRYSPLKVIASRDEINRTVLLQNFCEKCGKMISFEITDTFINEARKTFIERLARRWNGES